MKTDLTCKRLRELLHYCPNTGVFTHIPRDASTFKTVSSYLMWTRKFSGKEAGAVTMAGYRIIRADGGRYFAHRLAWLYVKGAWPGQYIDHINHDKLDNRIENLRDVSGLENCKNLPMSKENKSGCPGVVWHKTNKCWQATLKDNGKSVHLGAFKTRKEAIQSRLNANKLFGYHENHGMTKAVLISI